MDFIVYIAQAQVVSCRKCRTGLLMNRQFDTHFQRQHAIDAVTRREMRERVQQQYREALSTEQQQARFQYPSREAFWPQLKVHYDGLACFLIDASSNQDCQYVCRGKKHMIEHCRQVHGWINRQGRGGTREHRQNITRPWREGVACQRLFYVGARNGYWEVRIDDEDGLGIQSMTATASTELRHRMWQDIQDKTAELRAQHDQIELGGKLDANPWLERVGWAQHLQGFRWEDIIQWATLPQTEEDVLRLMCRSIDRVVDIAQEAMVEGYCPFFTRFDINKKELTQNTRQPFQAKMEMRTKKKYTQVLHRMLGFMWRTRLGENVPPYRLTAPQERAWTRFTTLADDAVARGELDEEDEESRDEEGEVDLVDDDDSSRVPLRPQQPLRTLKEADRAGLELWIQLLNHRLDSNVYESVMLSALAAIGVDQDDQTWYIPDDYTPKLSAVIKLSRMMVVLYGIVQSEDNTVQRIRNMIDDFMVEERPVPMSWLFSTRRYGLRIRYTTTAGGTIRWEGETVSHREIKFSMNQFRSWIHGMVGESRRVLEDELLLVGEGEALPRIPWTQLVDDPSNAQPGLSFINLNTAHWPVDGSRWLFQHVIDHREHRAAFTDGHRQWRHSRVKTFMRAHRRFKELLWGVMNTSDGQPKRATESLSIRTCNTHTGGRRNVFVEEEAIAIVTAYHKGYAFEGNTKIIHRYLPREVGELLVYYMWLVQPFMQHIEVAVYNQLNTEAYLWRQGREDALWTSDRVKTIIQEQSMIGMGVKLNISSYRQVAIAISNRYLKGHGFIEDREDEEVEDQGDVEDTAFAREARDSMMDRQAGHSSTVAGMIYARMITEAPGVVAGVREQYRAVSQAWHRLLGFVSAERGTKRKRTGDEDTARAMTRWKRVKEADIHAELRELIDDQAQFRGVQEVSLQAIVRGDSPILSIMGTGSGKSLLFMLPAACSARCSSRYQRGLSVVVTPMVALREDMQQRCQKLNIPCAEWQRRRPPFDVSVVLVTPESAVSKGFQEYLQLMQARQQLDRIVFDEIHTVLDSRGDFRPKLRRLGELMVAETQMVMLTATLPPSEEDELLRLMCIPRASVQIFRAPTSRPNIQYRVVKQGAAGSDYNHDDDNDDDDNENRHQKNHDNCRTNPQPVTRRERQVMNIVKGCLARYSVGRMVVYGDSVARVQRMAELVQCPAYFHDVQDKDQVFRRIMSATCRVVVATNALGLGIDLPDIRAVVHMDGLKKVRDFAQESGRAGRDGQRSESIVVAAPESGRWGQHISVADRSRIQQYCQGTMCSRVVLDAYLDGRTDRVGCESGEELCWVCQVDHDRMIEESQATLVADDDTLVGDRQDLQSAPDEIQYRQMQEQRRGMRQHMQQTVSNDAIEVAEFRAQLDRWQGQCPWCRLHGSSRSGFGHSLLQCTAPGVEVVQHEFKEMRRSIRYAPFAVCYQCGIPQAICDRYEQNDAGRWRRRQGRAACQYVDMTLAVVCSIIGQGSDAVCAPLWTHIQSDDVEIEDRGQIMQWLGRKSQWGELECVMLNRVFYWLVCAVERREIDLDEERLS